MVTMADAKSEKAELSRIGATAQKNSGRGSHAKGDGRLYPFTVDIKEYRETFGLSRKVWAKTCTDAIKNGDEPALIICLGGAGNTVRLAVIAEDMFQEMHEAWVEKYSEKHE